MTLEDPAESDDSSSSVSDHKSSDDLAKSDSESSDDSKKSDKEDSEEKLYQQLLDQQ